MNSFRIKLLFSIATEEQGSLAMTRGTGLLFTFFDCQDIAFPEDYHLYIIDFDFRTAVFGIDYCVADFDVHGDAFALISHPAWTDSDDFPFLGFFFSCIREYDAAFGFLLVFSGFDDQTVTQGL